MPQITQALSNHYQIFTQWSCNKSRNIRKFCKGQVITTTQDFCFAGGSNEDCALIRRSDSGLCHFLLVLAKTDNLVQIVSTTKAITKNTNLYNTTFTTVSTQSTPAKAFILTKLVKSGRNVTFSCPIRRADVIIEWYGPPDSRTLYANLSACPTRIRTLKHVRVYTDACVLFVEHELSWDDARKSCRSLGGDLVTVKDSGKENSF
ncbi:CD206 [Mytilus edulis]|uniref:MRC n=1 Tax=Mytilus edulis TaxID=6550 RepID=A0A8S3S2B8_MYTED|nr:CD206 [Mytilus edulis]